MEAERTSYGPMGMSAHNCQTLGHVSVGDDPECLVCGMPMTTGAKIHIHVDRPQGELGDPRSIANIYGPDGWGHAG